MLQIKPAGIDEIETIEMLAHAIWNVSYKGVISDEQISYMLGRMYSQQALTEQIQKLNHRFIVAYDSEMPVGFASYCKKPGDDTGIFRLNKIYLLPSQQGKGSGKFLLNYVIDAVKKMGATALELNVNKQNKALNFYTKNNFSIVKDEVIDIGNGFVMDDYVMLRNM